MQSLLFAAVTRPTDVNLKINDTMHPVKLNRVQKECTRLWPCVSRRHTQRELKGEGNV